MPVQIWDDGIRIVDTIHLSCAKALSQTINNEGEAVTADGGAQATIPITGHGYLANSYVYITGTTNYNGLQYITAVATNSITIQKPFVAETFGNTAYVKFGYKCPCACEAVEIRCHLSGASAEESLVVTIDSAKGSAYDVVIHTKGMSALTDYLYAFSPAVGLEKDDVVIVTYPNASSNTVGIEMKVRRIGKPGLV